MIDSFFHTCSFVFVKNCNLVYNYNKSDSMFFNSTMFGSFYLRECDEVRWMNNIREKIILAQNEIQKVVKGKNDKIEKIIAVILAKGHILLEDVPGVGKTTTALSLSRVLSLRYGRVQFTPDVLPTDITGFIMYNKQTDKFEYKFGAVMCNLFLADEINRTSPKTQSALLQVMEEGKVTIDGKNLIIPKPFIVIATQNPTGSTGTQKLPESQLDRFMIKISMGYPDRNNEIDILKGEKTDKYKELNRVLTASEIVEAQGVVEKIFVNDKVYGYIADLVNATRVNEFIQVGLSTRASIALLRLAKSYAFLDNRDYCTPEDVVKSFYDISMHRIVLSSKARMSNVNVRQVLDKVREGIEVPSMVENNVLK